MQPEMIERLDDRLEVTNQEIYFVYEALFDGFQKLNDTLSVIALHLTERREEGERENSPHTPHKEKEGEEKKARDSSRAREDNSAKPKKQATKRKEPQPRFKKPTVAEVAEYGAKRENGIDAEEFWHFYESKGWCIGKKKMTDWTSAVITWEKVRKRDAASRPSNYGKGQITYLKPTQEDINRSEGVL